MKSVTGELAAAKHLATLGMEVFFPLGGKTSADLLAVDTTDGSVKRIQVKTTSTQARSGNGWQVQLKSVRPNRSGSRIKRFNPTDYDLLVVYIEPEDRVEVFNTSNITQTCEMLVR